MISSYTRRPFSSHGKIVFSTDQKNRYKASGVFGKIELKELTTGDFIFYEISLDLEQPLSFESYSENNATLTYCTRGTMEYSLTGIKDGSLDAGFHNFLFTGREQATYKFSEGESIVIGIQCGLGFLQKFTDVCVPFSRFLQRVRGGEPTLLFTKHQKTSKEVMRSLLAYFENTERDVMQLYSGAIDLMRSSLLSGKQPWVVPQAIENRRRKDHHVLVGKLNRVRTHIDQNFRAPGTYNEIALIGGISEDNLRAQFKNEFGMTVFEYLETVRMKNAAKFLDQEMPLEKVRQKVGYKGAYSFNQAFKRYFGKQP